MAVTLEGGCRVSEMREGEPVVNGTVRIWNQVGKANGANAISLRVMEFAPGLSPGIRNGDCDEILYVVDEFENIDHYGGAESAGYDSQGQARGPPRGSPAGVEARSAPPLDQEGNKDSHPEGVRVDGSITISIDGNRIEVCPASGIYIGPNQVFAINNRTKRPVVVISAQCPDPDRAPQLVDASNTKSVESQFLPIVRLADRAPQSTADRWYRVLIDGEVGSEQVTQFVGSIPPGRAPNHFHHYEEVLFILKGQGRMWAGQTNTAIGPGSCIFLPKRQVHCVENAGTGELRLLGVFYPAGSPSVRYDA